MTHLQHIPIRTITEEEKISHLYIYISYMHWPQLYIIYTLMSRRDIFQPGHYFTT